MQLPTLPDKLKLAHQMHMPIRWGDMDALGHVNNTVYFRYMEIARVEWLRATGVKLDPQGEGVVIVNAFCNFHQQLQYPGDILVKTYVGPPGRSSFDTWVTIEMANAPGQLHASGGSTLVWVNLPAQKSAPLPEALRRHLAPG